MFETIYISLTTF